MLKPKVILLGQVSVIPLAAIVWLIMPVHYLNQIEYPTINRLENHSFIKTHKKAAHTEAAFYIWKKALMRPTPIYSLSTELGANTIDPDKLNCRVRNGNGCCLIGNNISLIKAFLLKEQIWYKEAIIDGNNNFFVYPGWNPSRRLLGGSSTSFQPI